MVAHQFRPTRSRQSIFSALEGVKAMYLLTCQTASLAGAHNTARTVGVRLGRATTLAYATPGGHEVGARQARERACR